MPLDQLKQVIVLRSDLNITQGKACAQAAHASVEAVLKSDPKKVTSWEKKGAKKVVLKVKSEKELIDVYKQAVKARLFTALIADAGLTELQPGTKTALGIGPDKEEKIDKITGKLKLL
ncbi:MAG TPA: peptidyl-tRNA hydrolase Pth2 [Candidatus Nanoarchaeia archaeon]|nr:peptidyl-tRNA hydrolase Pth2 [Candidatus Nanoarchaeia archaeon]